MEKLCKKSSLLREVATTPSDTETEAVANEEGDKNQNTFVNIQDAILARDPKNSLIEYGCYATPLAVNKRLKSALKKTSQYDAEPHRNERCRESAANRNRQHDAESTVHSRRRSMLKLGRRNEAETLSLHCCNNNNDVANVTAHDGGGVRRGFPCKPHRQDPCRSSEDSDDECNIMNEAQNATDIKGILKNKLIHHLANASPFHRPRRQSRPDDRDYLSDVTNPSVQNSVQNSTNTAKRAKSCVGEPPAKNASNRFPVQQRRRNRHGLQRDENTFSHYDSLLCMAHERAEGNTANSVAANKLDPRKQNKKAPSFSKQIQNEAQSTLLLNNYAVNSLLSLKSSTSGSLLSSDKDISKEARTRKKLYNTRLCTTESDRNQDQCNLAKINDSYSSNVLHFEYQNESAIEEEINSISLSNMLTEPRKLASEEKEVIMTRSSATKPSHTLRQKVKYTSQCAPSGRNIYTRVQVRNRDTNDAMLCQSDLSSEYFKPRAEHRSSIRSTNSDVVISDKCLVAPQRYRESRCAQDKWPERQRETRLERTPEEMFRNQTTNSDRRVHQDAIHVGGTSGKVTCLSRHSSMDDARVDQGRTERECLRSPEVKYAPCLNTSENDMCKGTACYFRTKQNYPKVSPEVQHTDPKMSVLDLRKKKQTDMSPKASEAIVDHVRGLDSKLKTSFEVSGNNAFVPKVTKSKNEHDFSHLLTSSNNSPEALDLSTYKPHKFDETCKRAECASASISSNDGDLVEHRSNLNNRNISNEYVSLFSTSAKEKRATSTKTTHARRRKKIKSSRKDKLDMLLAHLQVSNFPSEIGSTTATKQAEKRIQIPKENTRSSSCAAARVLFQDLTVHRPLGVDCSCGGTEVVDTDFEISNGETAFVFQRFGTHSMQLSERIVKNKHEESKNRPALENISPARAISQSNQFKTARESQGDKEELFCADQIIARLNQILTNYANGNMISNTTLNTGEEATVDVNLRGRIPEAKTTLSEWEKTRVTSPSLILLKDAIENEVNSLCRMIGRNNIGESIAPKKRTENIASNTAGDLSGSQPKLVQFLQLAAAARAKSYTSTNNIATDTPVATEKCCDQDKSSLGILKVAIESEIDILKKRLLQNAKYACTDADKCHQEGKLIQTHEAPRGKVRFNDRRTSIHKDDILKCFVPTKRNVSDRRTSIHKDDILKCFVKPKGDVSKRIMKSKQQEMRQRKCISPSDTMLERLMQISKDPTRELLSKSREAGRNLAFKHSIVINRSTADSNINKVNKTGTCLRPFDHIRNSRIGKFSKHRDSIEILRRNEAQKNKTLGHLFQHHRKENLGNYGNQAHNHCEKSFCKIIPIDLDVLSQLDTVASASTGCAITHMRDDRREQFKHVRLATKCNTTIEPESCRLTPEVPSTSSSGKKPESNASPGLTRTGTILKSNATSERPTTLASHCSKQQHAFMNHETSTTMLMKRTAHQCLSEQELTKTNSETQREITSQSSSRQHTPQAPTLPSNTISRVSRGKIPFSSKHSTDLRLKSSTRVPRGNTSRSSSQELTLPSNTISRVSRGKIPSCSKQSTDLRTKPSARVPTVGTSRSSSQERILLPTTSTRVSRCKIPSRSRHSTDLRTKPSTRVSRGGTSRSSSQELILPPNTISRVSRGKSPSCSKHSTDLRPKTSARVPRGGTSRRSSQELILPPNTISRVSRGKTLSSSRQSTDLRTNTISRVSRARGSHCLPKEYSILKPTINSKAPRSRSSHGSTKKYSTRARAQWSQACKSCSDSNLFVSPHHARAQKLGPRKKTTKLSSRPSSLRSVRRGRVPRRSAASSRERKADGSRGSGIKRRNAKREYQLHRAEKNTKPSDSISTASIKVAANRPVKSEYVSIVPQAKKVRTPCLSGSKTQRSKQCTNNNDEGGIENVGMLINQYDEKSAYKKQLLSTKDYIKVPIPTVRNRQHISDEYNILAETSILGSDLIIVRDKSGKLCVLQNANQSDTHIKPDAGVKVNDEKPPPSHEMRSVLDYFTYCKRPREGSKEAKRTLASQTGDSSAVYKRGGKSKHAAGGVIRKFHGEDDSSKAPSELPKPHKALVIHEKANYNAEYNRRSGSIVASPVYKRFSPPREETRRARFRDRESLSRKDVPRKVSFFEPRPVMRKAAQKDREHSNASGHRIRRKLTTNESAGDGHHTTWTQRFLPSLRMYRSASRDNGGDHARPTGAVCGDNNHERVHRRKQTGRKLM